jgi:hypothetical protein
MIAKIKEDTQKVRQVATASLGDRSAQVFPYNIFSYCSICGVDCKFARNTIIIKKKLEENRFVVAS